MAEEDLGDNYKHWVLMKSVYMLEINGEITLSKLARKLAIASNHPYFRSTVKYLMDLNIIKHVDNIGSCKIVKINNNKLADMLRNKHPFIHVEQLIKKYKPFTYNI